MTKPQNHQSNFKTIVWIAWRNMVARRKRAGLSFMTVVSIAGVAIGVAALIIVLSVMGGFEQDLRSKMLRGQPHVELMAEPAAAGFSLLEVPVETIMKTFPEATDAEPFTQADVVLKQRRHLTSAELIGVDPNRTAHLWGFNGAVTAGELDEIAKLHPSNPLNPDEGRYPGIALGDDLAVQLGADLGDEIIVMSPQASVDTALGGGTISHRFIVVAKFTTGLFNYDAKWAVVALPSGRKFLQDYDESLDEEQYVTGVAFNLKDPLASEEIVKKALGVQKTSDVVTSGPFKGLKALTWQNVNKSLLFALKLEKFAMGSILMLIVLVAAFSISGTMMMTVFHKRGQVSLLRSLGMTRSEVARLFLAHGFTIGTVGICVGLAAGVGVVAVIDNIGNIPLPSGIYHLKALPSKWLWFDYGVICVCAWLFSLLAATYPALTAAKQDPGTGLRYL